MSTNAILTTMLEPRLEARKVKVDLGRDNSTYFVKAESFQPHFEDIFVMLQNFCRGFKLLKHVWKSVDSTST
ncbi:unnamed protein product [Allacma fusca]|uniref:Uncharacterized protein n=1 Tax=Allacma fusca TaxID=39272 RepID=A0A8J2PKU1_9HEXA|nr:unnamed protein product [Allacma fusca]